MQPFLVAGTNSWDNDGAVDWYCPGHPFGRFLEAHECAPTYDGQKPFIWSTDVGGVPWARGGNYIDWAAGAAALSYFITAKHHCVGAETGIIAHSHALQVVAFAASDHDLKVDCLITVGSPLRKDMRERYKVLRANTRHWLHIHSDRSDNWQWLGTLFDGHFGVVRETPLADENAFVPKVGHSELLRDPLTYHHWLERRWLDQMKG